MVRDLVDTDRLPVELDLVHDLAGILGVVLGEELAEPVALVRHGDAVLGQMHIHYQKFRAWWGGGVGEERRAARSINTAGY
jgi:hypothetical protein